MASSPAKVYTKERIWWELGFEWRWRDGDIDDPARTWKALFTQEMEIQLGENL